MKINLSKLFIQILIIFIFNFKILYADTIKEIEIFGNDRISIETIKLFSNVSLNEEVKKNKINEILKNLFETGFFNDVAVKFEENILTINVVENPIIENIIFKGIKANKIEEALKENSLVKSRYSYNKIIIKREKLRLEEILKELGYYRAKVDILVVEEKNNLVDLVFNFDLGEKAKITKITFVGNKIYKDNKLRRVIASEEFKFWKFITGKKFLNKNLVNFDTRLLKNFYKNNGYYNVEINSSFAKQISENEFELIFNIDAGSKVYFGDLNLILPTDFDKNNFKKIDKLFKKIKNEPYSINTIDKILDEIDLITSQEQYQFINAVVDENLINNKINLNFKINETEKYYIKKINILGNNITSENVIRNQLEVDEGDPFNEILVSKSINNLKGLGFFRSVDEEITNLEEIKSKVINISVSEKPTGEIFASAGFGTDGTAFGFGVKENNFLGQGIKLNSELALATDSIKGKFSVTNPNYRNSDKSVYLSLEAIETDNYKTYGYKTNKTGVSVGTNFEYYDDFFLGLGTSNFYEKIETNSTASARQQSQEGNYWDSFLKLDFNYDKRNQKFQTSSGYSSFYSLDIPVVSDTNTLKNYFNYSYYFDLFEKNISNISFYFESANSLNNKDIKLSERINIPGDRLRGFEIGRVGPKDGDDFIGGNFAYSINFSSTIPQLFEESQNLEFLLFSDIANIWGVDYNSSLKDNKVRSSVGLALDWYSPIGPMNFSLSHPISKSETDKTQSFRFNLGTTF